MSRSAPLLNIAIDRDRFVHNHREEET